MLLLCVNGGFTVCVCVCVCVCVRVRVRVRVRGRGCGLGRLLCVWLCVCVSCVTVKSYECCVLLRWPRGVCTMMLGKVDASPFHCTTIFSSLFCQHITFPFPPNCFLSLFLSLSLSLALSLSLSLSLSLCHSLSLQI